MVSSPPPSRIPLASPFIIRSRFFHSLSEEGLRGFAVYLRIAEILDISDQEAAGLFSFWEYVQQERTEAEKTGQDAVEELASFLKGKIAAGKSPRDVEPLGHTLRQIVARKGVLAELFDDCPRRDLARKSSQLESGPLPHLSDVRTFCDLRPIFNKDATEIVDHVALITLRLAVHSGSLDETKEVLISLRELDLKRIDAELQRARKKLELLKKSGPAKPDSKPRKSRGR